MNDRRLWEAHVAKLQAGVIETATRAGFAPKSGVSKYHSKVKIVDGIRFPSGLEARCYEWLKFRRLAGEVLWFIRQPCFNLEGSIRYYADFLAVLADGSVSVIDAKGILTDISRLKIKQTEARYGIKVQLWGRK